LGETLHGVLSLQLLQLARGVLVQEFVDREVATADADVDLVLFDLDGDALAAELVDTLALTHEHNFQVLAIGVVVDVLSDALVDHVVLDGNVDGDSSLQVDNVVAVSLDLGSHGFNLSQHVLILLFELLHLLQELEVLSLLVVELVLEVLDVCRCSLQVVLQLFLLREHLLLSGLCSIPLLFNVL